MVSLKEELFILKEQIFLKTHFIHVIKMSLGGACRTSLGPHLFTIAPRLVWEVFARLVWEVLARLVWDLIFSLLPQTRCVFIL